LLSKNLYHISSVLFHFHQAVLGVVGQGEGVRADDAGGLAAVGVVGVGANARSKSGSVLVVHVIVGEGCRGFGLQVAGLGVVAIVFLQNTVQFPTGQPVEGIIGVGLGFERPAVDCPLVDVKAEERDSQRDMPQFVTYSKSRLHHERLLLYVGLACKK